MVNNKQLLFVIYLPSFLLAVVQGLLILLAPLLALKGEASWLEAGFLMALKNTGTLFSSLPAGFAIARYGDKRLMLFGAALMGLACLLIYYGQSYLSLLTSMILFGLGMGSWTLARQTFMSAYIDVSERGRYMSVLAAVQRGGMFVGPLLAGIVSLYYDFEIAFLISTLLVVFAFILLLTNKVEGHNKVKLQSFRKTFSYIPDLIKTYRSAFINSALFMVSFKWVRAGIQLLIPLWGHQIGLVTEEIAFAFAITAFLDIAFLYLGGSIADRYGRKWSGGLSLSLLSLSLILLNWSNDYASFLIISALAGVSNGLGGGIIMTIGADLAPSTNRGLFLGSWRLVGDVTGVLSPLLIGGLGALFTLGVAAAGSGAVGLLGTGLLIFYAKETLDNAGKKNALK